MTNALRLYPTELFLPLKTVFKQASSVRAQGESVWCEARRNKLVGFGEGCPRTYVTNEDVPGALAWVTRKIKLIEKDCTTISLLKEWISENRLEIDQHPAAFCAIETALLDLFAREEEMSVEKLLGQKPAKAVYTYTGVLGDSSEEKFIALCQRYLAAGFTDFKVKVNGDLSKDQLKLQQLQKLSESSGLPNIRIRLDANNLWQGNTSAAIHHLSNLAVPLFGIEEPVAPKNFQALSEISRALDLPIILDESLCSLNDLEQLDQVQGRFIGNIKVSRLGGVIRSLEMVRSLQTRGHRIIVGAHVGETSVLTRAGMCVARAAGSNLAAQEGGYGLMLLEREPIQPSLMFAAKGQIDLAKVAADGNWEMGWGLKK